MDDCRQSRIRARYKRPRTQRLTSSPDVQQYTDSDRRQRTRGSSGRTRAGSRRRVRRDRPRDHRRRPAGRGRTVRATERSRVDDGYDDVLLPTDGSEAAAAAVDHGLAIAEATGARVHPIHVVDVGGAASTTRPAGLLTELESEGERVTEQIATRVRASGLDAVPAVRRGSLAEDILAYVDDNDIDIVTM